MFSLYDERMGLNEETPRYTPTLFSSYPEFKGQVFYPGNLEKNRELFASENLKKSIEDGAKQMGFSRLIKLQLSHSTTVYHLKNFDFDPTQTFPADSIIVDIPQVAIALTHADCQATLIYDRRQKRFAAVHAGWRGLFGNIYIKTIEKMCSLGSKSTDLLAFLGPSLGLKHAAFENYRNEIPKVYHQKKVFPHHFDLKAMAKEQFLSQGLLESNIEISPLCTAENNDFCSYRRAKKQNGSMSARNFTICGLDFLSSPVT
ncbi:laccase domain-containing protein [bacterium]|nr:laccase domain-containing protein [bacterium]